MMQKNKNRLFYLLFFITNILFGALASISQIHSLYGYNLIFWEIPNKHNTLLQMIIIALLSITVIVIIGAIANYLLYKLYRKYDGKSSKVIVSICLVAFILGGIGGIFLGIFSYQMIEFSYFVGF